MELEHLALVSTTQPHSAFAAFTQISPVSGHTWLDIVASGFWGGWFEWSYFDVRVFNPHAASNQQTQLSSTYRHHGHHENVKRQAYEHCIQEVEHVYFTPLVMSLTGGLGHAATTTYKCLGSLLAEKWDTPYATVMARLCCRLSFSLLYMLFYTYIRGVRSTRGHAAHQTIPSVDLASREAAITN